MPGSSLQALASAHCLCQLLSWGTQGKSLIALSKIPGDPSCTEFPSPDPHVSSSIIYEGSLTGHPP
jgi:hypothetical protein